VVCRFTVDEISEIIYWSDLMFVDLKMSRVAAKCISHLLTQDQKNNRLTLCQDLKYRLKSDLDFLKKMTSPMTRIGVTVIIQKQKQTLS